MKYGGLFYETIGNDGVFVNDGRVKVFGAITSKLTVSRVATSSLPMF